MAQAEDVRRLKEQLEGHPGPMLSVYLSVNARYEENQGQAYKVRLRDALDEMEIPEEFRFFVSAPMEEPGHASKGASSGFFREVDIESNQPYPKVGGTTDHDPAGYTRQAHLHRFFKELAELTHKLVLRDGVKYLILAGPKERTAEFRDTLPQDIQERVVAEEQVEARGPENEALEKFEDIVARAERARKAGLIE